MNTPQFPCGQDREGETVWNEVRVGVGVLWLKGKVRGYGSIQNFPFFGNCPDVSNSSVSSGLWIF